MAYAEAYEQPGQDHAAAHFHAQKEKAVAEPKTPQRHIEQEKTALSCSPPQTGTRLTFTIQIRRLKSNPEGAVPGTGRKNPVGTAGLVEPQNSHPYSSREYT